MSGFSRASRFPEEYQIFGASTPRLWPMVGAAQPTGMKYVVLTSSATGLLPLGQRVHRLQGDQHALREGTYCSLVDAFRAEGLRVGFYYSLIDWHHPDFPSTSSIPAPIT